MNDKTRKILIFAASITICQFAGMIGGLFTSTSVKTWYPYLQKPAFQPPDWLFFPVWTVLFVLMGISLYIVWTQKTKKTKKKALTWFSIQLGLNILWSALFFGLKSPTIAFIELIILWTAIILTIVHFYKISKTSAYLLIPYLLWVSFAAVLNLAIVLLNA